MCQRRHLQDYVNEQLDGRALTTGCNPRHSEPIDILSQGLTTELSPNRQKTGRASKLDREGYYNLNANRAPPRQSRGFRPEDSRRICQFDHASHRGHEIIHLLLFNDQRRGHFQYHEIVTADLREKTPITEQPHHDDLPEHSGMNGSERLIGNPQAQLSWGL